MDKQPLDGVLQHIRNVAAVQTCRDLSDSDLLERFIVAREEAAFTVLIERHRSMVLGVCRRALPHLADAEDACQATFLVLARKAASVRKQRSLTGSLETAWLDLAKQESREAYKAEGRFLASPSEALKLFAEKIKPVEPLDATRIQQLLADLDNAKFAVRESASKALGDLGQQAKPYLEEVVKTTNSAEVLNRARKILDGLKKLSPEQIRQTRVVLVLELIGDDESRNLLKRWASGLKGALLTEEASEALQRRS